MKRIVLFLMVLMSVPSLAQDVVEDTLAVVENAVMPEINYLTITSDQQNSMIYINGEFVGFNKAVKSLNVGEAYTWKVECDMYQPESGNDTMTSGEVVMLNMEMQAAFGLLNVTTLPEDDAMVFVDNKHIGNTPLASIKMPVGQHKMLVFRGDYSPYCHDFEIIGNDTVNVNVEMIPNIKEITIVADDMSEIYVDDEFKGTGNSEIILDRKVSDKRIFPAINIEKSGTRKEELLYHPDELHKIYVLRRALKGVISPTESMEMLLDRIHKTNNNIEFLMSING